MQKIKMYTNFTFFPLLTALYRKKLFSTLKSFIRILIFFQSLLIFFFQTAPESGPAASIYSGASRKKTGMSRPERSG